MNYQFIVITNIPKPGSTGNLATAIDSWFVERWDKPPRTATEVLGTAALYLNRQVFIAGEILVCNEDGREIVGHGRKPDKWDVEYESFDNIEAAIKCARNVYIEVAS